MNEYVYDEEEIGEWRGERKHKNIFLNVIPLILFALALILILYAILAEEYESGSIAIFLIALVICICFIIVFYRRYRHYGFLKIYRDKIILPNKPDIFNGYLLRGDTCYLKYIKKVYPNINSPQKYVTLLTTDDDPTWKGEPIPILKGDIYSVENFLSSLEELDVIVERNLDYEVMSTPGLSTALRGKEVEE